MIKCEHCHLEYRDDVMIEDNGKYFCCKGCQGIYHLLKDEGLDSFYSKLKDTKLAPPKEFDRDLSSFDSLSFRDKYIKVVDSLYEVSLVIEGIHCTACVWLNEKVLKRADGIIKIDINYTTNKAKILFDSKIIQLSEIVSKIQSIGYDAFVYDPSEQESRANRLRKDFYIKMAFAIFASMNVMWLAIAKYAGYFSGMSEDVKLILDIAEFVLATPTLFFSGFVFYKGAYFGLKNGFVTMDLLVSTGATLTYSYSIYAIFSSSAETYFDSVTMIITFVLVGKFLEVLSKKRAVDVLDTINSKLPTEVNIIRDSQTKNISIYDVKIGDLIEVKAGDKLVIDGEITQGEGSFDESSLSGESIAIYKKPKDRVLSGSILLDSRVVYRATKDFSNSTLSIILNLLEDALNQKPNIEILANRLSRYFSLTIFIIALTTLSGWIFYLEAPFERSFIVAISVIIIACPCALALATPVASLIGLSLLNSKKILLKESKQIETMAKADILALDKTGTLTEGRASVVNFKKLNNFNVDILYSLVNSSKHPISQGVARYLKDEFYAKELHLSDIKDIKAKGIRAKYKELEIIGGSLDFMRECGIDVDIESNKSLFLFAVNSNLICYFELEDRLKPDAKEVIKILKRKGIKIVMLTGDRDEVAKEVAQELNIDYRAKLMPEAKAKIIDEYHKDNKIVVMVGDGINDILALSKADISIAMKSGSDVAIDVSDIILLNNSLESLKDSFLISKRVYRFIKENLLISLLYNLITIPLAIAGLIIPLFAALSMSLSSILVILNSMRIKNYRG